MEKQIAVYKIQNLINNKVYIGSSINYEFRISCHINLLKKGKHHSKKLQNSWNKYGQDNFKFEIIEEVFDLGILLLREQYYIDLHDSYVKGYNMCIKAGSRLGSKCTDEGRKNMKTAQLKNGNKYAKKRLETMLNKDPDIFKKIAKKSSETQIKNGKSLGFNNPNSNNDNLLIFNDKDEVVFTTKNFLFKKLCEDNNLPHRVLEKSKLSNGTYKLYMKMSPINKDFVKYKGWYCKYENTIL